MSRGGTNQSRKRGAKAAAADEADDPNRAGGRMLKTEEIRFICDKHQLTRMEVYNIRSQFAGMCLMSKEDEQKELDAQRAAADGKAGADGAAEGEARAAQTFGRQAEGIGLNFFKKNCSFLAGCRDEIVERILVAHGLDIESSNATIHWATYLELYCIFEAGKMEKQTLIRFWIKFFDNGLHGQVPEPVYMQILEQLVRGKTLDKPSSTTNMFAKMFKKMMANAGCLGPQKEIINEKLAKAFEREDIDIQLLCSALGRQQLDESFLNMDID